MAVRDAGAVSVGFLMAGRALKASNPPAIRTSYHVREMRAPCVALLRIIHCCVAVDAARMNEDRTNLLPSGETLSSTGGLSDFRLLRRAGENTDAHSEQKQSKSDGCAIARHIEPPDGSHSSPGNVDWARWCRRPLQSACRSAAVYQA